MNDRLNQFATTQPIKKSPRAFTLVELLVVIAIVGGLAALVIPTIKSATASARSTEALSNLKQTGVLVANYAAENDNRLPLSAFESAAVQDPTVRSFGGIPMRVAGRIEVPVAVAAAGTSPYIDRTGYSKTS